MLLEETIRDLISRVNSTLAYFEKDYVSVKRTPTSDKERCSSFEQFIEARFNFECCQIPELVEAVISTDGHVFTCISIENPDLVKRRFTTACVIVDPNLPENLKKVILELFGGTEIVFNNVRKKIKYTIK